MNKILTFIRCSLLLKDKIRKGKLFYGNVIFVKLKYTADAFVYYE